MAWCFFAYLHYNYLKINDFVVNYSNDMWNLGQKLVPIKIKTGIGKSGHFQLVMMLFLRNGGLVIFGLHGSKVEIPGGGFL